MSAGSLVVYSGKGSERHAEGARPPRRQTNSIPVSLDFQPEPVLTFSLMIYH